MYESPTAFRLSIELVPQDLPCGCSASFCCAVSCWRSFICFSWSCTFCWSAPTACSDADCNSPFFSPVFNCSCFAFSISCGSCGLSSRSRRGWEYESGRIDDVVSIWRGCRRTVRVKGRMARVLIAWVVMEFFLVCVGGVLGAALEGSCQLTAKYQLVGPS